MLCKIGKEHYKAIADKNKSYIFSLCDELWESGFMEESFIACNWSYNVHKDYEPADFDIFERWVNNYVSNWASCDTLCNHTVGTFIEMYPESIIRFKKMGKIAEPLGKTCFGSLPYYTGQERKISERYFRNS